MRPNKSRIQADKCSGGAVLLKPMVEKSYLPVSFLAHFIYMLVPAKTLCDSDAQIFVFIDNLKGFIVYFDGWN